MPRTALIAGFCVLIGFGCQVNASSTAQPRTASRILVHYPASVRTPQAWKRHHFAVDGVPVQPSEKVPESELLKYVGKKVSVSGRWNPGVVWMPTGVDRRTQTPVELDRDQPVIRGDGIVVETLQELKGK